MSFIIEDYLTRNDKYWHMIWMKEVSFKCDALYCSLSGRFTEMENTVVVVRPLGEWGKEELTISKHKDSERMMEMLWN